MLQTLGKEAKAKSHITKRSIEEFTSPDKIPTEIEDEILDKYSQYSLESDMTLKSIPRYLKDLEIPKLFTKNNLYINDLTVEGTDIIDFDKLLLNSFQLIKFRDNKDIIIETWNLLRYELKTTKEHINLVDLIKLNNELKLNLDDRLLLGMINVNGQNTVNLTIVDFAYIMGKMGELTT
ncbi:hypothetical protein WICMUC_005098 [Wickerhamomyces mucosus]|uniref:Uncharacterized protein n=1 Tax=Wickerhamomyces mucosus TaxID=1378264 RepID=A0A9P8PD83_9ASCO|nr:hypothetical protein WICMUC_005098 [Wickerhamomyces mucosus]